MSYPQPARPHAWRFEAIGTTWQVDTASPLDAGTINRVEATIAGYDAEFSRFRPDSRVSRAASDASAAGTTWDFPPGTGEMLTLYRDLYAATDGAVSPLVARSLERLGYDAAYSLRPSGPPLAAPSWDSAMTVLGDAVTFHQPSLLDVGAAGKGQLVDLVAGALRAGGHASFTVDAGGDLLTAGSPEVPVALEFPGRPGLAVGVASVSGAALAGSGVDRRRWGPGGSLHHVVDARTGEPTRQVIATWASAEQAMLADGIATALFFASPAQLTGRMPAWRFSCLRIFADHSAEFTADFPGESFT